MKLTVNIARCKAGNVRKRYAIQEGALSLVDAKMYLSEGVFEVIELDSPAAFGAFLDDFPPDAALCAGVPRNGKTVQNFGKVEERDAGRVAIARCIEDLQYADTFPLLIDYDGGNVSSPHDVWQKFVDAIPEAAGAAWVAVPSSSRFIYGPNGEEVIGGGKYHLYVIASGNGSRFREILKHRAGKVFDTTPMHSAALHYEAAPVLPKGYEQRKPAAVVSEGGIFGMDAIDLPPAPERPEIEPIPLTDDLQRMKLEEVMGHLLGEEMNPGSSTYDLWMKIINSLTNMIGADAAADYAMAIAPKRKRNEADRIARTAPRWVDPMGCLFAVAKRYGFSLSAEYKKAWGRAKRNEENKAKAAAKATKGTAQQPTTEDTEAAPPSLRDQCIEIAGRGLSGSALDQALLEAGQSHRVSLTAAREMFEAVCEEADRDESRGIVANEVTALERDLDASLDLHRILPPAIADEMYRWAEAANIKPEGLLMALLSGISTRHNPETRLRFHKSFRVSPAIWAAMVSPSGEMKSPILQAAAGTPLGRIEWELKEVYDREMADWKERRDEAKKDRNQTFSDPPPQRRKVIGQESTYEKALDQLANQPNGYLLIYDELPSLVKSLKDRLSELLTLFNGTPIHKMIKGKAEDGSDRYTDIRSPLIGFLGGIQPGKLQEELRDGDDDGFWARYLYSYQPPSHKDVFCDVFGQWQPDEDDPLVAILEDVYRHAGTIGLVPSVCGLDEDAVSLYKAFNDRIEAQRLAPDCPDALGAILAKARGYVGRVALSVRIIWDAYNKEDRLNPKICGGVMAAAILVMEYHLAQVRWIYANVGAGGVESLPAKLQKILRISNGKPISASDCKKRCAELRKVTGDRVKGLFDELVKLELGEIQGTGRTAKFCSFTTSSPKVTGSLPPSVNEAKPEGEGCKPLYIKDIDNNIDILSIDINQSYQINHPEKPPTQPDPNPHPFGDSGKNGKHGKDGDETHTEQGSQSLPGAVHENDPVVKNGVATVDRVEIPKRGIERFETVDNAADLQTFILIYGRSRYEAYLEHHATPERRAFLEQLEAEHGN